MREGRSDGPSVPAPRRCRVAAPSLSVSIQRSLVTSSSSHRVGYLHDISRDSMGLSKLRTKRERPVCLKRE